MIDDSGEDYLYPTRYFIAIELPLEAEQASSQSLLGARQPQTDAPRVVCQRCA